MVSQQSLVLCPSSLIRCKKDFNGHLQMQRKYYLQFAKTDQMHLRTTVGISCLGEYKMNLQRALNNYTINSELERDSHQDITLDYRRYCMIFTTKQNYHFCPVLTSLECVLLNNSNDRQCTQQQYWHECRHCSWLHAGLYCIAPRPFTWFVFYLL